MACNLPDCRRLGRRYWRPADPETWVYWPRFEYICFHFWRYSCYMNLPVWAPASSHTLALGSIANSYSMETTVSQIDWQHRSTVPFALGSIADSYSMETKASYVDQQHRSAVLCPELSVGCHKLWWSVLLFQLWCHMLGHGSPTHFS